LRFSGRCTSCSKQGAGVFTRAALLRLLGFSSLSRSMNLNAGGATCLTLTSFCSRISGIVLNCYIVLEWEGCCSLLIMGVAGLCPLNGTFCRYFLEASIIIIISLIIWIFFSKVYASFSSGRSCRSTLFSVCLSQICAQLFLFIIIDLRLFCK